MIQRAMKTVMAVLTSLLLLTACSKEKSLMMNNADSSVSVRNILPGPMPVDTLALDSLNHDPNYN